MLLGIAGDPTNPTAPVGPSSVQGVVLDELMDVRATFAIMPQVSW